MALRRYPPLERTGKRSRKRAPTIARACNHQDVPAERFLVNLFYAHAVGHAVEALHYCLGHHVADPTREVAVALNAATAVELAGFCPFVSNVYPVDHPLLVAGTVPGLGSAPGRCAPPMGLGG
jgi:hypothetical protein